MPSEWKPTHACRTSSAPHSCPFCGGIGTGVYMEEHIRGQHVAEAMDHLATERHRADDLAKAYFDLGTEVKGFLELEKARDPTLEEADYIRRINGLLGIDVHDEDVPAPDVTIWTDGCCLQNPGGNGGWGYVVSVDGEIVGIGKGGEVNSTNNRMELMAVITALETNGHRFGLVEIVSDSKYVVDGLNLWVENWKRNGWTRKVNRRREAVKNLVLWQRLDGMFNRERMTIRWTKGHNGDALNEEADRLAMIGAREVA